MQFQADIMNTSVVRPVITETTALGAAYLAGLAVGYWPGMNALEDQWKANRKFSASMDEDMRIDLTKNWHRAVNAAVSWAL